jgi:hypothetical protein
MVIVKANQRVPDLATERSLGHKTRAFQHKVRI